MESTFDSLGASFDRHEIEADPDSGGTVGGSAREDGVDPGGGEAFEIARQGDRLSDTEGAGGPADGGSLLAAQDGADVLPAEFEGAHPLEGSVDVLTTGSAGIDNADFPRAETTTLAGSVIQAVLAILGASGTAAIPVWARVGILAALGAAIAWGSWAVWG